VEYLRNIGALDRRLLAAHCVHVSPRDLRWLAQYQVKVSTQVSSNSYLGSGIAPLPAMLAQGLTVGIGTDDANCNDAVNPFAEMRLLSHLHRAHQADAEVIDPETLLEMATLDGARALGMEREIGSLEVGKKADVVLINLRHPQMTPHNNLSATLVFQAQGHEVDSVWVDGQALMRNRQLRFLPTSEEPSFYQDAQDRSLALSRRARIRIQRRDFPLDGEPSESVS
jgi:cytosine/adenosine deaminase-related metal-dependent hydrolase